MWRRLVSGLGSDPLCMRLFEETPQDENSALVTPTHITMTHWGLVGNKGIYSIGVV